MLNIIHNESGLLYMEDIFCERCFDMFYGPCQQGRPILNSQNAVYDLGLHCKDSTLFEIITNIKR